MPITRMLPDAYMASEIHPKLWNKRICFAFFDTMLSPGSMDVDLGYFFFFFTGSWQSKMMARKKHEVSMFLKKATWCGKHLRGVEMQGAEVSCWEGHLKGVTEAPLARKEPESAQRWGWEATVPGTADKLRWVPSWCRAISSLIKNLPKEDVTCTCSSVHSPGHSGQRCSPHRTAGTDREQADPTLSPSTTSKVMNGWRMAASVLKHFLT